MFIQPQFDNFQQLNLRYLFEVWRQKSDIMTRLKFIWN